jgi:hypothetical protein
LPNGPMRERIERESGKAKGQALGSPLQVGEGLGVRGAATEPAPEKIVPEPAERAADGGPLRGRSSNQPPPARKRTRPSLTKEGNCLRAAREDSRLKAGLKTPAPDSRLPAPRVALGRLKAGLKAAAPDSRLPGPDSRLRATRNSSRERRIMRWKPETRVPKRVVDRPPPGKRLTSDEQRYYDWAYFKGGAPDYQTIHGLATLPSPWPRWKHQRELPPPPKRRPGWQLPVRPVGTARERFDRVRTRMEFQPKGRRVEVFARLIPRGKNLRLAAFFALVDELQRAVEYVPPRERRSPRFWGRLRRAVQTDSVLRADLRHMAQILSECENEWPKNTG